MNVLATALLELPKPQIGAWCDGIFSFAVDSDKGNRLAEYASRVVWKERYESPAQGCIGIARQRDYLRERMLHRSLTFALTCDGAFLLRARRREVQRVVRQRALSLGGPPWLCKTVAAQPVLHRQV